jgi:hypothetical protein
MEVFFLKHKEIESGPYTLTQLHKTKLRKGMQYCYAEENRWMPITSNAELTAELKKQTLHRKIRNIIIIVFSFIFISISGLFIYKEWKKQHQPVPQLKPLQPDEFQYTKATIEEKIYRAKKKKVNIIRDSLMAPIGNISLVSIPNENPNTLGATGIEARKRYIRNHISEFVRTSRSSFMFNESSGVQDISVVVENTSEFIIDEVTVRVDYIGSSREHVSSEYITFENLTPYRVMRKIAPSRTDCRSLVFLIVSIKSKPLSFYFTPDRASSSSSDPFHYVW